MMTENGKELKLGVGLEVFNDDENPRHLENKKAVKVLNRVLNF